MPVSSITSSRNSVQVFMPGTLDNLMMTVTIIGIDENPPTLASLQSMALGCRPENPLAPASWCAGSAIKRPCEPVPVTHAPGGHRPDAKRRVHRCAAASSAAKASTPCGDQLIPWCLQRADTAQSLYFSTSLPTTAPAALSRTRGGDPWGPPPNSSIQNIVSEGATSTRSSLGGKSPGSNPCGTVTQDQQPALAAENPQLE